MAQNKILPWAQTGTANVLSDDAYAADVATGGLYGDGVKTGQASSQQANKTWRQATAPGAGLGQFLVDNLGVDVTDADTPSTFSTRIANAVLKLAQISPFNQSWATATGGYRKYAIVSDSSGNYWVSTADQNTTVPGANGANWQSLFNGYATQAWANSAFVKNNAGTQGGIVALDLDGDGSGRVTFEKADGSWGALQLAGDYATQEWANSQFLQLASASHQTITGPVTFSGSLSKDAPAGSNSQIQVTSGGSERWNFGRDGSTETGTSAGSNFVIARFNNSGSYIDSPFGINRETGVVSANVGMEVPDIYAFTGKDALNAETAEGRYVRSVPATGGTNVRILDVQADPSGNMIASLLGGGTDSYAPSSAGVLPGDGGGGYRVQIGNILIQSFWVESAWDGLVVPFPIAFLPGTIPIVVGVAGTTNSDWTGWFGLGLKSSEQTRITNTGINLSIPCQKASDSGLVQQSDNISVNIIVMGRVG